MKAEKETDLKYKVPVKEEGKVNKPKQSKNTIKQSNAKKVVVRV